jgi:tryptophan synthase alpha chain
MKTKILETFLRCKNEQRPVLITYTVAGDSTKKQSLEIIKSIAEHADIIELGFPHNTPVADGGQIQESSHRALKNGIKLPSIFHIVKHFKKTKHAKPLILIVVDLPYPENKFFSSQCKNHGLTFVQLLSPTTSKERMKKIINDSHDMIYYISMLSTTGGKLKISPKKIIFSYNQIKKNNPKKNIVIGFGITTKTIAALKKADGLVVGSQLCKEITRSLQIRQNPVTNLNRMVLNLKRKII